MFIQISQKRQILPKIENFRQIIAKINKVLEKTCANIHAKFQNDR